MTLGSKHTIQYTDDVLYNCTLETFIILLTNATPIYSVQKKRQIGYTKDSNSMLLDNLGRLWMSL